MSDKRLDFLQPRDRLTKRQHRLPAGVAGIRTNADSRLWTLAEAAQEESPLDYVSTKAVLHQRLIEHLERNGLLGSTDEQALGNAVNDFILQVVDREQTPLNQQERDALSRELKNETLGLGPLAPLMADPAVSDVLVNGVNNIYVERYGKLEKTNLRFHDEEHLVRLIQRIIAGVGRRIDESSPYVDARLPDGSRVNATLPPVTVDGPTLSIRRFGRVRLSADDFVGLGSLSQPMLTFLAAAVQGRQNIAISGGTGAGKSTLLAAIARFVPPGERIITIEDTAELRLDQPHVIRCETRPRNTEGSGEITCRELLRNALRMRPDRIIVGEVRGAESFDMLQAMNTGHEGSMTTLHANSPRDALSRLESMVLMAGADLPSRAIREQFVSALNLLIHVERQEDGVRRVISITEVTGMEGETPQTQEIFRFFRSAAPSSGVVGRFDATGIVPRFVEKLRRRGVEIPPELFQPQQVSTR